METATTVTSWQELGIYDRTGGGRSTRTQCPSCTPTRRPEHQREKDFVISDNGEVGHCHHCGFSANIRTIQPRIDPGAPDSYLPMPPPTHQAPPVSSYAAPEAFKTPNPTPGINQASYDAWEPVLAARGLDIDVLVKEFNVSFIERSDLGHTMVIPQYHPETGELSNHKYRGINKDFRNDTGTMRPMFNLHRMHGADTIVIVEGEMDVFAIEAAGFPHVISVPDGAPPPNAKNYNREFAYLELAMPILEEADRVIIAVDNDEGGDLLRKELENRIGVGQVAHIRFPDGIKDANDALCKLGDNWLKRHIAQARPTPASGVYTPRDMLGEVNHALKYGFDTGTPIGFPDLDKIYRPTLGHLTIITGHAGSGKSTVLDNFVIKLAISKGWPIAYFSPEQMPLERHLFNLAEIWLDQPIVPMRAKEYGMEPATHQSVLNFIDLIDPYISHISPEMADDTPSLEKILDLATAEVRRNGIKGLVLDPWNEIETARPTHITETEWVSIALGRIRRWARTHSVHVWLVAHPKKMKSDDGRDAIPGLGDISGSNNFRNKADYGLSIYKIGADVDHPLLPGQNSAVGIRVCKSRWRDSARVNGEANFLYNPATNRISTPPQQYASMVQRPQQYDSLY